MKFGVYRLRNHSTGFFVLLCLLLAVPSFARTAPRGAAQSKAKVTSVHSARHRHGKKAKRAGVWKKHGQQEIDAQRTRDIQEALIRQNYLSGAPSGTWDSDTKAAMQKFQSDQGWQTKRVPDARALIKLGLGPNHEANTSMQVAGAAGRVAEKPQR
ncbi:MAG: peptidoglycan-binding domain-containing protein [Acidobacteriaceae bacterium]